MALVRSTRVTRFCGRNLWSKGFLLCSDAAALGSDERTWPNFGRPPDFDVGIRRRDVRYSGGG